ncbi:hypothetical protein PTTG_09992, partial [Puccinia triticina 1-1 BBBD Race 1]
TRRTIQESSTGVDLKTQIATSEASALPLSTQIAPIQPTSWPGIAPTAAREESSSTMTALTTAGLDPPLLSPLPPASR